MTVREWCSHTANVFYGATMFTIYGQANGLSGPSPVASRMNCQGGEVLWITVTKINPDNMGFLEVAVTLV